MAGYGASLDFDEQAMRSLPVGRDKESKAERKKMFRLADYNGNGICSLAECDRLIVGVLHIEGVKIMKPVINRAFHAARDIVPSVGSISPHYVDLHEFRYFLLYLQHYLELFIVFAELDTTKVRGKYSDRRMSYPEFEVAIPKLIAWGLEPEIEQLIKRNPQAVFQAIDDNGGGVVLFDEFAHWALWNHIFKLNGEDDEDMEEALDVLRKQKPNLCGKDLTSIKASKAKYRADARISGQGCLGGDPSLSGGYDDIPDGGKELANGRHYPGGLKAWQASFNGGGKDAPGRYRCVAKKTFVGDSQHLGGNKIDTLPNGTEVDVLEVFEDLKDSRVRARIAEPDGWISLLNCGNGFRWAVRLRQKKRHGYRAAGGDFAVRQMDGGDRCSREIEMGENACVKEVEDVQFRAVRAAEAVLGNGWRDSYARVQEASEAYEITGMPTCINGCGQPRFGRYPTCCTHCEGEDGPHAHGCIKRGYDLCVNGCGHPQFGKYDTCCTHCKDVDGPHARGCEPRDEGSTPVGDEARVCVGGCGRAPFRTYPTCCTHCQGPGGPHAQDCDERHASQGAATPQAFTAAAAQPSAVQTVPANADDTFTLAGFQRAVSSVCTIS